MLLPSATKLRRLCFYTCLSFCSHERGVCLSACWDTTPPPREQAPPDQASLWDQTVPLGPGIPPGPGTPPKQRRLLLRMVRILLECILVVTARKIMVMKSLEVSSAKLFTFLRTFYLIKFFRNHIKMKIV